MSRFALVGTPNAGKTALFNSITRSNQRVANYAGVTVDSFEADFSFNPGDKTSTKSVLIDLPGAYSLRPYTDDEEVLTQILKNESFDGMVIVIDATQLERGVRFAMEVLDATTAPAVVALNMADLAESRGFEIDIDRLSQHLGVPVIPTVAVKKKGITKLLESLNPNQVKAGASGNQTRKAGQFFGFSVTGLTVGSGTMSAPVNPRESSQQILSFYKKADAVIKDVLKKPGRPDTRSQKIDHWILHPFWGVIILVAVLGITFQLMFNLAEYPMNLIEAAFTWVSAQVSGFAFLPEVFRNFLVDGVIAGVGGTLVFLPQILILFLLILFLEDFGFMARAVFLLDYWMGKVGLHGRAFLPLLSSYACAIPGILSAKAIESKRDRIATILMIPLATCSARIPVYTLLISAFIPNEKVFFGFKLQGLVMLGLYATGTLFALLSGAVLKRFFLKGTRPPLLIELPSYKWPSMASLGRGLLFRAKLFTTRVGTIILALTILIWVSVSFPKAPEGVEHPIEYSFAAKVGHVIEPVLRPIGFDWRIGMAMVPAFAAREVMVSALTTAYLVEGKGEQKDAPPSEDETVQKLSQVIKGEWSLATGLSLMVWVIFSPQCISTIATARRELKSWKWTGVMVGYLFALAYGFCWLTYHITLLITG